ncbi:hypothetical protein BKA70DRAFT_1244648 [Coprinopsis sp. MPI-PUGE-AT-0042]|nr:hypothetical protein BKA70DRAFT_1244648 [Coprinopsis sp. MPI-PUGE-AT-0042]
MYASVDRADRRTSLENIMVLAHDVRGLGLQIAEEWPHIEEYAPHIGLLWRKLHESEETMNFLRELPVRGSQDVQGADGGLDMHAEDPFKAQDSHRGRIGVGAGDLRGMDNNRRIAEFTPCEGDSVRRLGRQMRAVKDREQRIRGQRMEGNGQDTGEVDDWEDVNDNEEPHGGVGGEKRKMGGKGGEAAGGDVGADRAKRDVAEVGAKGKRKRPEGPSRKKDRKREEEDEDDDDDDDDGEEDSYPPSKNRCQNCVRKGALCFARPRGTCTACHDRKVGTKGRNRGHQGLLATRSAIEPSAKQSTSTTDRQKTTRLVKSNAGEMRAARMPTVTPKGRMIRDGNTIPTSEDDGDAGEGDGGQGGIPDGGVSRPSRTTRRNEKGKANEDAMNVDAAEDGEGAGIPDTGWEAKGTEVDVAEGVPLSDATLRIYGMTGELMGEYRQVSAIRNTFTTELASTKDKVLEMVKQHEKATLAKVETRAKKSAEVLEQELQEALKKVEETKEMLDAERATISVKAERGGVPLHRGASHRCNQFEQVEELQTELQTLAERQEVSRMKSRQEYYGEIHTLHRRCSVTFGEKGSSSLVEVTTAMSIKSLVGDRLDGMARSIKRMETEVKVLIDDSVKGCYFIQPWRYTSVTHGKDFPFHWKALQGNRKFHFSFRSDKGVQGPFQPGFLLLSVGSGNSKGNHWKLYYPL